MLYEDEDDVFLGSPKSKFFDVLLHANRNLVEYTLEKHIERYIALNKIIEKLNLETKLDIDSEIINILINNQDDINLEKKSFFLNMMGDILTQNE